MSNVVQPSPGWREVRAPAACRAMLTSSCARSDAGGAGGDAYAAGSAARAVDNHLLFMEGSDHLALHRIVASAVGTRAIERVGPLLDAAGAVLVERLTAGPTDVVPLLARAVAEIACEVVGFDEVDVVCDALVSSELSGMVEPRADAADAARARVTGLRLLRMTRRLVDSHKTSRENLLSALLEAYATGAITHAQLIATPVVVLHAAYENTLNFLCGSLARCAEDPSLLAGLRSRVDRDAVVEELLRRVSPAKVTVRSVDAPFDVEGLHFQRGEMIAVNLAAANAALPEVGAGRTEHLAFGAGVHVCAGRALARAESRSLLGHVASAFVTLELCEHRVERGFFADHTRALVLRGR